MVLESTWRVQAVLGFILIRNYNVFLVDMDYLVQVDLHFSKELQWLRGGHGNPEDQHVNKTKGISMIS